MKSTESFTAEIERKEGMVILHIAAVSNNLFSGICVAVPWHIITQQKYATVGFINIKNVNIPGIKNTFEHYKKFSFNKLPDPFNTPNLVVFHEVYHYQYIKLAKQLRKNSIPYIIVPHGSLTKDALQKKKLKKIIGNILMFNSFIDGARAIQCLSQNEADRVLFDKERFVSTNGIELPKKYKTSFRNQHIHITYIGRLEVYTKGIDLMIEAIKLVIEQLRKKGVAINIYGPDYQGRYTEVENLIQRNGIGDVVTLHPAIMGEEKERVLLDTDLFIQTSRTEGMPMGILEAMSYGVPCLITEGTSIGEIVRSYGAGFVCKTNNKSVANMLMEALSSLDIFMQMSKKSRELIKNEFDWNKVGKASIKLYEDLSNYDDTIVSEKVGNECDDL